MGVFGCGDSAVCPETIGPMKLPNGDRAIVDDSKLRQYCLNPFHWQRRHKAKVFASIGIGQDDSAMLKEALLSAARESEAGPGIATPYGQRYVIDVDLVRHGRTVTFGARGLCGWKKALLGLRPVMYYEVRSIRDDGH